MSASEQRDRQTPTSTPQPGDWVVWTLIVVVVGVLLTVTVINHNRAKNATPPTPAPVATPYVAPPHANSNLGTRVWNPITLPHDSKATFTTTFRNPGVVDYQFFLTGDPDTIRKLFESHPQITLSLLGEHNNPIEHYSIDPHKLNLNGDGFILHEASFEMPIEKYNSIADWNVEIRFDKCALAPPQPPLIAPTRAPAITPAPQPMPAFAPAFAPAQQPPLRQQQQPPAIAPPAPITSAPTSSAPTTVPPLPTIEPDVARRLETLEKIVFGRPAHDESLTDRLDRLENQVLNQTFPNSYPDQRIRKLESSVYGKGDTK